MINRKGLTTTDVQIEMIEITSDRFSIPEAKRLLALYGDYIYKELNLIAGKESFYYDLENFPAIHYQPPLGIFVVAKIEDVVTGGVAIKKFSSDSCEMKRLFVLPEFRGQSIGVSLCNWVIEWCRKKSYKKILLDTNMEMNEAFALYHKLGFKEIIPYCNNENDHPIFMELEL